MAAFGPLLVSRDSGDGPFDRWLEVLDIRDFVRRYSLEKLIEWRWLVPQFSVRFPVQFFHDWKNYPYGGDNEHADRYRSLHILWDSEWFVDAEDGPNWFLHPFFREDDAEGRILREGSPLSEIPEATLKLGNGRTVVPFAHYFFHWQAYALADVVSSADCGVSLFATPDIETEAALIAELGQRLKNRRPQDILRMPNRWGGHAEPMTWLSHYRALRSAVSVPALDDERERQIRRRGARLLATHLSITEEKLEHAIENNLLVLAQQWYFAGKPRSRWTEAAWPELQKDILLAVEWLCTLNGRTIEFYFDKWRHQHFGEGDWRELRKALPFEWFSARDEFIELAPIYLKLYNDTFPDCPYTEQRLKDSVDRLRATNYPFGSLLRAFYELHNALTYRAKDALAIDVRDRRPLDYYLLLAIRVEGVLRQSLELDGALLTMPDSELGLSGYIRSLGKKAGVSNMALEHFRSCEKIYTRLKDTPPDPIADIIQMKSGLSAQEHYLVQAFLCCVLARNYFAHHYYLDRILLRAPESGFLLGGLLVTALKLA
jgi:hypothetical protein